MGKIINKLNLNRTPQIVENNSLIYAKNIRLTPDDTLCADTSLQKILSNYIYKGHIVGINNNIHLVLENNNTHEVKLYTYNEINENISLIECGWTYSGGEIYGNVVKNATNEEILTICEYSENKEIPIKHINLQRCKAEDNESIYTQNPIIPITNLHNVGKYNCAIPNGVYQFFIRYKIAKNFYTNWYSCSGDLHAGESKVNDTIQGSLKYIDTNTDCPKSFIFQVEHLIPNNLNIYKEFQLGFILTSGDTTVARSWKHFPITLKNNILFDYDQDFIEEINIDDLLDPKFEILNVRNITNYKNKQYIANYKETNIDVTIPTPDITLHEATIGEQNIIIETKSLTLHQLHYSSEKYEEDNEDIFSCIEFYAKSFEKTSGQDDSNHKDDKVLGNLYLIYKLAQLEKKPKFFETYNPNDIFSAFTLTAKNRGDSDYKDGYALVDENNESNVILEGELEGHYSYNWGAPNKIKYHKVRYHEGELVADSTKHPLERFEEFKNGNWFYRKGFDGNNDRLGFEGNTIFVGTDSRHCEGDFCKQAENLWKNKITKIVNKEYPKILITAIYEKDNPNKNIITTPISISEDDYSYNKLTTYITDVITNSELYSNDLVNYITVKCYDLSYNYVVKEGGNKVYDGNSENGYHKIILNVTAKECEIQYSIDRTQNTIDNSTLSEYNRTLMPFSTYEFYIHGVKENGIITNGTLCNSHTYNHYNHLNNKTEIIYPKINISKNILNNLNNLGYKAWFISTTKLNNKIAKGFNYFYDEETKYHYIQCLEADTLLFNLNKNITIYKQQLYNSNNNSNTYNFNPVTTNAEYISSGNNTNLKLFGNVGVIRWKDENNTETIYNYKPTTRTLSLRVNANETLTFTLYLVINRTTIIIENCSYNINKSNDSINIIKQNINDAISTNSELINLQNNIEIDVKYLGELPTLSENEIIIGVTNKGSFIIKDITNETIKEVTNDGSITINQDLKSQTIYTNNIDEEIQYYKNRQNELRTQYINLTSTNVQNAQAVIDLTSNTEYTPIIVKKSRDGSGTCIRDFSDEIGECAISFSDINRMNLTTGNRTDIANIIDTTQQELYNIAYNPIKQEYDANNEKINKLSEINKDSTVLLYANPKGFEIGTYNEERIYKIYNNLKISISSKYENEESTTNPINCLEIDTKPISNPRPIFCLENDYWIVLHKNTENKEFKQLTRITPYLTTLASAVNNETNYIFEDYTKMYLPAFICQIKKLDFEYCKDFYINGTDVYKRLYEDDEYNNNCLQLERYKGYVGHRSTDTIIIPSEYNLNCVNIREDIVTAVRTWEESTFEEDNETNTYNQFYKAVNSLLLSSIYELPTMYRDYVKQHYYKTNDDNIDNTNKNIYNNTIRVSNADLDEQYRHIFKFSPEDYYIIPSNKGIITNLFTILDDMFIHTQHALYKFAGRNSLTTEGGEVALKETDVFDTGIQALLDSVNGFGGLNNKHHQTITYNNYIFYDAHNNVIYSFGGQQGIEDISRPIRYILDNYFPENVIFTPDELNNRVFINLKLKDGNICLTYSFLNKSFISIHDIDFSKGFNTRLNTYFIGFDDGYQTIHKVVNYIKKGDDKKYLIYGDCLRQSVLFTKEDYIEKDDQPKSSIDILYNEGYETIKVLDYVNWINCRQLDEIDNSNMAEPSINEKYPGHTARIYSDRTNTGVLKLIDIENNDNISNDKNNLLYPDQQLARYNEGVWSLNSFRNILTTTEPTDQALIYGKYFVFRLIMDGYNFKLENIDFKIMDYGKV